MNDFLESRRVILSSVKLTHSNLVHKQTWWKFKIAELGDGFGLEITLSPIHPSIRTYILTIVYLYTCINHDNISKFLSKK